MKVLHCVGIWLLVVASGVAAEKKPVLKLWPKGLPKGAQTLEPVRVKSLKAKQTSERITYVEQPSLTLYRAPAKQANGCGLATC